MIFDKESLTTIEFHEPYTGSLSYIKRNNNYYLLWDISNQYTFSKYILYSSDNKNDILYLTNEMQVVFTTTNYLSNSYQVQFDKKNTKYFKLAVLFTNGVVSYTNIVELHNG